MCVCCEQIAKEKLFDGGLSLDSVMAEGTYAVYIGETERDLHKEDLGFLTERGSMSGGVNRPVLRWLSVRAARKKRVKRSHIWMKEARKELSPNLFEASSRRRVPTSTSRKDDMKSPILSLSPPPPYFL